MNLICIPGCWLPLWEKSKRATWGGGFGKDKREDSSSPGLAFPSPPSQPQYATAFLSPGQRQRRLSAFLSFWPLPPSCFPSCDLFSLRKRRGEVRGKAGRARAATILGSLCKMADSSSRVPRAWWEVCFSEGPARASPRGRRLCSPPDPGWWWWWRLSSFWDLLRFQWPEWPSPSWGPGPVCSPDVTVMFPLGSAHKLLAEEHGRRSMCIAQDT